MVARRLNALPAEAIVRGYLIGSGWKDYQRTGAVCGIGLPEGLRLAERLPEPIFTPSTKAALGSHDEKCQFCSHRGAIGVEQAEEGGRTPAPVPGSGGVRLDAGIIIADTKFEFGLDEQGQPLLMDEVLTPDSSRFWPADQYRPGVNPPSFDKQFVRDYLETLDWDKQPPGPELPFETLNAPSLNTAKRSNG